MITQHTIPCQFKLDKFFVNIMSGHPDKRYVKIVFLNSSAMHPTDNLC